jgi:hypothetical protein
VIDMSFGIIGEFINPEKPKGGCKMKTKTFLLTLSGIMLSLALMGQKNLLLQDIQPMMAHSNETKSEIILSADYRSNSYEFYMEDKILVKDWMISERDWLGSAENKLAVEDWMVNNHQWGHEVENELVLEDWMVEGFSQKDSRLAQLLKEERESPLILQDWMICCKDWQASRL